MLRCLLLIASLALTIASKPTISDIHRSFPAHQRNKFHALLNAAAPPSSLRPPPHSSFVISESIDQNVDVTPGMTTTLTPNAYGADPYGLRDSTAAFQSLIIDMFLVSPNGTRYLSDRVIDLGGVTVDLEGGDYLISKPIVLPAGYGNYKFTGGSIRANVNFPKDQYLIHIGNDTDSVFTNCGQCSWSQYIDVTELLLDSSHIAAGGVSIIGVMGAVLSKLYVIGFTDTGVRIVGGHEVQLTNSWFGEQLWRTEGHSSINQSIDRSNQSSGTIGVSIFGYDDVISNVIVFSAGVGAYIKGACNLIYGLHTWNGNLNGVWFDGDMDGSASAGSNRIDSSYLDFSNLIITNPSQMLITNNFFLGGGHIVLRSDSNNINPMTISGLVVTNNQFNAVPNKKIVQSVELDESNGSFNSLIDVTFTGNVYTNSFIAMSTRVRTSKVIVNASEACFDLSTALLFPQFPITFFITSFQTNDTNIQPKADVVNQINTNRRSRHHVVPPPLPPQPSSNSSSSSSWPSPIISRKLPSSLASNDHRGACVVFPSPVSGIVFIEVDQSSSSQMGGN